jgi:hypothetical protein
MTQRDPDEMRDDANEMLATQREEADRDIAKDFMWDEMTTVIRNIAANHVQHMQECAVCTWHYCDHYACDCDQPTALNEGEVI